jgi:acyl dehydratase
MNGEIVIATMTERIGTELGVSPWVLIDQAKIDAHAELTGDGLDEWIHTDPEKAAELSPTGTTIAQGFLQMSHLSKMIEDIGLPAEGVAYTLNYGFDRVRMINPVPAGSRIRGRFTIKDIKPKGDHGYVTTVDAVIEIEGQDQPAIISEWLFYARVS